MRTLRLTLTLALALAAGSSGCKRDARPAPAGAGPAAPDAFTMADLASATELDARVARLSLLASEYKMAMTFQVGARLRADTDRLGGHLERAAGEVQSALDRIRDPRDRERASRVVVAARRWPALLSAAREELLGPPDVPAARAAAALGETDEEVARGLDAYRRFRAGWRIADAPSEDASIVAYLEARRSLEQLEATVAAGLPGGPPAASSAPRDAASVRKEVEAVLGRARTEAARIDPARRDSATRWVQAEAGGLQALLDLGNPKARPEEQARSSLLYQKAKVDALEALAEYTRLTAARTR